MPKLINPQIQRIEEGISLQMNRLVTFYHETRPSTLSPVMRAALSVLSSHHFPLFCLLNWISTTPCSKIYFATTFLAHWIFEEIQEEHDENGTLSNYNKTFYAKAQQIFLFPLYKRDNLKGGVLRLQDFYLPNHPISSTASVIVAHILLKNSRLDWVGSSLALIVWRLFDLYVTAKPSRDRTFLSLETR